MNKMLKVIVGATIGAVGVYGFTKKKEMDWKKEVELLTGELPEEDTKKIIAVIYVDIASGTWLRFKDNPAGYILWVLSEAEHKEENTDEEV